MKAADGKPFCLLAAHAKMMFSISSLIGFFNPISLKALLMAVVVSVAGAINTIRVSNRHDQPCSGIPTSHQKEWAMNDCTGP